MGSRNTNICDIIWIYSYRYICDNLPRTRTAAMAWPRVKEGRGRYHQEDTNYAGTGKEKDVAAQVKMAR